MAVLAEAISVIVRIDAIDRKVDGGRRHFDQLIPNATACSDGELVRIGFMSPEPVKNFIDALEEAGLTFRRDNRAVDIAVVDQLRGKMLACDWLEFGTLNWGDTGRTVSACWLVEGPRLPVAGVHVAGPQFQLATPPGWQFEDSMSMQHGFVPNEEVDARLTFIRSEDRVDVFRDNQTGEEVYVARG